MTTPVTWFELGQAIAEAHTRRMAEGITVVPVILDDAHAARPILRALAETHDGCLLDATNQDVDSEHHWNLHKPVPGTRDPNRRNAIEVTLSRSDRRVVLAEQEDGTLDARFLGSDESETLSAGDQMLHAIARGAAHRHLDDYEFAILVYSNGPLDARAEEAAWNLIMQRIHGSQRAIPQTLILAIESGIDIATHCQPETGFRYAIEHGQLVRRRGKQHLRQATAQIAEQCRSSPVVLLLGAGFSVSSRLPLGDELRDNAIMRLLNDPSLESLDSIDLGVEFHTWLSELSSTPEWISREELLMDPREFASGLTLERVLVVEEQFRPELPTLQEFKDRHDEIVDSPGPSVVHLAKILESWDAKLIVAQLNFDCLLERNTSAPLKPFISDEEFGDAVSYIERYCNGDEDSVPLLKLHGTIDEIETCVATQDQTNRGLATTKFRTLISLLDLSQSPLPWIYIGASMRDRDLLQTLNGQQFAKGLDEQWVIPYIVRSLKKFGDEREPHWKDSGLRGLEPRVITETSDAFFEMLAESEF